MVTDDSVISHLMVVIMAAAGSGKLDPSEGPVSVCFILRVLCHRAHPRHRRL